MSQLLNKNNLLRGLFFALVFSIPFGSYLFPIDLDFIVLSSFRIALFLSVPVLFFAGKLRLFNGRFSQIQFFLMLGWILYGVISYFWAIETKYFVKEIFYLFSGTVVFIVFQSYYYCIKRPVKTFFTAWFTGFFTQFLLSLWEMNTGNHLYGNFYHFLKTLSPNHFVNWIPVSTFNNPNNFSIYLVLSSIFFFIARKVRPDYKDLFMGLIAYCFLAIYLGSSRLGVIAILTTYGLYLLLNNTKATIKKFTSKKLWLLIALSTATFIYILNTDYTSIMAESRLKEGQQENAVSPKKPTTGISSTDVRKNLIINGLHYFKNSCFLGVGAGGYEPYTLQGKGETDTDGMINPHNWTIQVLANYGIIIFLPVYGFYLLIITYLLRHRNTFKLGSEPHYYLSAGIMLFVVYAIISNSDSSFINNNLNWITLTSMTLISDEIHKFSSKPILPSFLKRNSN